MRKLKSYGGWRRKTNRNKRYHHDGSWVNMVDARHPDLEPPFLQELILTNEKTAKQIETAADN